MDADQVQAAAGSIEAVATVLAVVIASIAGLYAKRSADASREAAQHTAAQLALERDREHDRDELERRAQANQIGVWIGLRFGEMTYADTDPYANVLGKFVVLQNASQQPVYDVDAVVVTARSWASLVKFDVLGPTSAEDDRIKSGLSTTSLPRNSSTLP